MIPMLKTLSRTLGGVALCALLAAPALAADIAPGSTDADAIMKAMENRSEGDNVKGRLVMTLIDKSGAQRQRVVRSWIKNFDGGTRQLMIFESPADVANTGLLSVDYDDGAKDDDQRLYLPSLKETTRIASGDRSGSFMGTDLSFADMTRADPSHYSYKMLDASAKVGGEDVWLIESRPTTDKAKAETGYLKTHIWVSKSKLVPLQIQAWVIKGKRLKQIQFKDYEKKGDAWVPRTIQARTLKGKKVQSMTKIEFTELEHDDPSVTDELFTERRLEKGL